MDGRTIPAGSRLDADLCIVGAGAAGITLARELAGSDFEVVLLEAGGYEPDARTQALYRGELAVEGNAFSVAARHFVLATGGVENARLLLASRDVEKAGLGNAHGVVGRYHMDNVKGCLGMLAYRRPADIAPLRLRDRRGRARLVVLAERPQREERLVAVELRWAKCSELPMGLAEDVRSLARAAEENVVEIHFLAEQPPLPENRITLSEERDELGTPRVRLCFSVPEVVRRSVRRAGELLALEAGRLGIGRMHLLPESAIEIASEGTHPMGSTRMAADPRRGVVDADCKVHGLANLYVAGSSVFPTCGTSNPTVTIVALALRLADHLRKVMT